MKKVSKRILAFRDRLVATGLWYIDIVSFSVPSIMIIKIRGKVVDFGEDQINDIYGLSNANMADFKAKGCEPGSSLVESLGQGKEVSWVATKRNISITDFTTEAQVWSKITYS